MKTRIEMNRRGFLINGASYSTLTLGGMLQTAPARAKSVNKEFEIARSKNEWREILTPDQFKVLRLEATEKKYTSPLLKEKRLGTYHCGGCGLPAYHSTTKYDSKTGWPSFYQSISGSIGTKQDNTFFSTRKEVHCRRCGGHFGHIFNDGPAPTGKRHCLNGLALKFRIDV